MCHNLLPIVKHIVKEITVSGPDGTQEKIEVPVWNGTAANIILMSLGPRCYCYCYCYCYWTGLLRRSCSLSLEFCSTTSRPTRWATGDLHPAMLCLLKDGSAEQGDEAVVGQLSSIQHLLPDLTWLMLATKSCKSWERCDDNPQNLLKKYSTTPPPPVWSLARGRSIYLWSAPSGEKSPYFSIIIFCVCLNTCWLWFWPFSVVVIPEGETRRVKT